MEGIDNIKHRILEDARQLAGTTLEQAENEASDIIKSAREEAESKKTDILDRAAKEAEEKKKRMISVAQLEERKMKLKVKQELIEEALSTLIQKLNKLPDKKYETMLVELIVNAVRQGNEAVILSHKDKQRVSPVFIENVNKKLKGKDATGNVILSPETRDFNGGFILKSGDVEINNSFDAIIRMQRDDLEMDVVKVLFN